MRQGRRGVRHHHGEQGVVGVGGLLLQDVQASSGDGARLQRGDERRLVHHRAAARAGANDAEVSKGTAEPATQSTVTVGPRLSLDEDGMGLHHRELLRADEANR